MFTRTILFGVALAALALTGLWFLNAAGASGGQWRVREIAATPTAPPLPTEPPSGNTAIPSPTPWLDAPHNQYIQPVLKQEATATPTQGTYTPPPPPPTAPPPPLRTPTAVPVDQAYAPLVIDTASTATFTPTATATIDPDATPTNWLQHTPPPP